MANTNRENELTHLAFNHFKSSLGVTPQTVAVAFLTDAEWFKKGINKDAHGVYLAAHDPQGEHFIYLRRSRLTTEEETVTTLLHELLHHWLRHNGSVDPHSKAFYTLLDLAGVKSKEHEGFMIETVKAEVKQLIHSEDQKIMQDISARNSDEDITAHMQAMAQ